MSDAGFAALAAARWIHFASVMLLFGASLFPFYALPAQTTSPELGRLPGALRLAALLAFLSGLAWAAASLVNITGDVDSLFDRESLAAFLFDTGFGNTVTWRPENPRVPSKCAHIMTVKGDTWSYNPQQICQD